jgi:hypothetical protein
MPDYAAFARRLAEIPTKHSADPGGYGAVEERIQIHLEWARAAGAGDPDVATVHFREAEEYQRRITSWATAGGEGLAGMRALYEIRVERARLYESLADLRPGEARRWVGHAEGIYAGVVADPNGLGTREGSFDLRPDLARVRARLEALGKGKPRNEGR